MITVHKKIDARSGDAYPSQIDLFSVPHTQTAYERTYEREFLTLNPHKNPPITFRINTGGAMVDLQRTRIVTVWKLQILKEANLSKSNADELWENTADKDQVSVVNGFGAVFPMNVKLTIDGQVVCTSNTMYSFKAMIELLLNTTIEEKRGMLEALGYFYDDSGKLGKDQYKTSAWINRRDLFTGGKLAEFSAPLFLDLFNQNRLFMSNTELEIEILPASDDFLIVAPEFKGKARLELKDIKLYMTFVDLLSGPNLALETKLTQEPAVYPCHRTEIKNLFYEYQRTEGHNTLYSEQIPRFMCFAFVNKNAYNGSIQTDPFEFIHSKIMDIRLFSSNVPIPFTPFNLDFANNKFIRAFEHFNKTVGLDTGINRSMFQNGWTLFPFNLTSSLDDVDAFEFIRDGPTALYTRFHNQNAVPEEGLMVIVYTRFDSIFFIDKLRQIRTDQTIT